MRNRRTPSPASAADLASGILGDSPASTARSTGVFRQQRAPLEDTEIPERATRVGAVQPEEPPVLLLYNLDSLVIGLAMLARDQSLTFEAEMLWTKGAPVAVLFWLMCAALSGPKTKR
jgi:hypothetical protein